MYDDYGIQMFHSVSMCLCSYSPLSAFTSGGLRGPILASGFMGSVTAQLLLTPMTRQGVFLLFFLKQEIFQANRLEMIAWGLVVLRALAEFFLLAHWPWTSYKVASLSL